MAKISIYFFIINILLYNSFALGENYFTLRGDKVNLRQGPSLDHPIKLFYKKKFLPVKVIDKSYNFRKIIDHENNSGWIHISQLSKKKAALNNANKTIIFSKPSEYSKPLAVMDKGRLCIIKKCQKNWCRIKTGDFTGWVRKKNLSGRL